MSAEENEEGLYEPGRREGLKVMMGEPTKTADLCSWKLTTLDQPLGSLHRTNLGLLHRVTVEEFSLFVRFLAGRSGPVPGA